MPRFLLYRRPLSPRADLDYVGQKFQRITPASNRQVILWLFSPQHSYYAD